VINASMIAGCLSRRGVLGAPLDGGGAQRGPFATVLLERAQRRSCDEHPTRTHHEIEQERRRIREGDEVAEGYRHEQQAPQDQLRTLSHAPSVPASAAFAYSDVADISHIVRQPEAMLDQA
jgi:hypothetical protein